MADRALERALRIVQLRDMFYEKPSGYASAELAERLGVTQRSIERDLEALQDEPFRVPLVRERRRWRLMVEHMSKLPPLHLSQQEATALFVAGRLLDQVSDEPNPYIGWSLEALARILPPEVAEELRRVLSPRLGEEDSPYARVFDVVARAWVARRCVRIRYRAAGREEERETVLQPYWLETSTEEVAAYVIGYASHAGALRVFKLERIQEAELWTTASPCRPGGTRWTCFLRRGGSCTGRRRRRWCCALLPRRRGAWPRRAGSARRRWRRCPMAACSTACAWRTRRRCTFLSGAGARWWRCSPRRGCARRWREKRGRWRRCMEGRNTDPARRGDTVTRGSS